MIAADTSKNVTMSLIPGDQNPVPDIATTSVVVVEPEIEMDVIVGAVVVVELSLAVTGITITTGVGPA